MHMMKAYGAVEVQCHSFLTLALDGQVHASAAVHQGKSPQNLSHWTQVGPPELVWTL